MKKMYAGADFSEPFLKMYKKHHNEDYRKFSDWYVDNINLHGAATANSKPSTGDSKVDPRNIRFTQDSQQSQDATAGADLSSSSSDSDLNTKPQSTKKPRIETRGEHKTNLVTNNFEKYKMEITAHLHDLVTTSKRKNENVRSLNDLSKDEIKHVIGSAFAYIKKYARMDSGNPDGKTPNKDVLLGKLYHYFAQTIDYLKKTSTRRKIYNYQGYDMKTNLLNWKMSPST